MPLTKARLIELIRDELNRQAEISRSCGLYVYGDEDITNPEIGVDGMLDLDAMAANLLAAFIAESRTN